MTYGDDERWSEIRRLVAEYGRAGGGADDAAIAAAEELLGPFPSSYRRFVAELGWLDAGRFEFFGLGTDVPQHLDVVRQTLGERDELEPGLPDGYVVLAEVGNGDVYCLPTGTAGEAKVYVRDHEVGGAEEDLEEEAADFGEWLLEQLRSLEPSPEVESEIHELITGISKKPNVRIGGPIADAVIREAEQELGSFPGSYRRFVARYGWLETTDFTVCGIGADAPARCDAVGQTRRERAEFEPELPPGFIVIHRSPQGNIDCLAAGDDKARIHFRLNEFGPAKREVKRTDQDFDAWLHERLKWWPV